jgi:hypothetical protein
LLKGVLLISEKRKKKEWYSTKPTSGNQLRTGCEDQHCNFGKLSESDEGMASKYVKSYGGKRRSLWVFSKFILLDINVKHLWFFGLPECPNCVPVLA